MRILSGSVRRRADIQSGWPPSWWPGSGSKRVRPGRQLKQLTKTVIETALDQELTGHLRHKKHGPPGHETGNARRISTSRGIDKCLEQVLYRQVLPGLIDPI